MALFKYTQVNLLPFLPQVFLRGNEEQGVQSISHGRIAVRVIGAELLSVPARSSTYAVSNFPPPLSDSAGTIGSPPPVFDRPPSAKVPPSPPLLRHLFQAPPEAPLFSSFSPLPLSVDPSCSVLLVTYERGKFVRKKGGGNGAQSVSFRPRRRRRRVCVSTGV